MVTPLWSLWFARLILFCDSINRINVNSEVAAENEESCRLCKGTTIRSSGSHETGRCD